MKAQRDAEVARGNDNLRQTMREEFGRVVLTDLFEECANREIVLNKIKAFDFAKVNAHGLYTLRDFGSIIVEKQKFLWKINYYKPNGIYSANPKTDKVFIRVLTIMLGSEFNPA